MEERINLEDVVLILTRSNRPKVDVITAIEDIIGIFKKLNLSYNEAELLMLGVRKVIGTTKIT